VLRIAHVTLTFTGMILAPIVIGLSSSQLPTYLIRNPSSHAVCSSACISLTYLFCKTSWPPSLHTCAFPRTSVPCISCRETGSPLPGFHIERNTGPAFGLYVWALCSLRVYDHLCCRWRGLTRAQEVSHLDHGLGGCFGRLVVQHLSASYITRH
jgi:hypothetical protein